MDTFEDIPVGHSVDFERKITEEDVYDYAKIVGDESPIHLDEDFAKKTKFGQRVVYGMLIASFFVKAVADLFEGLTPILLSQEVKFKAPVFINDNINFKAVVQEKINEKKRIVVNTVATNVDSGKEVVTGKAYVKL